LKRKLGVFVVYAYAGADSSTPEGELTNRTPTDTRRCRRD